MPSSELLKAQCPSEQRTQQTQNPLQAGSSPATMRLGPAIRLLPVPLKGCMVPKAHISAKPAKTPTSPSVSACEAAGLALGRVFSG